MITGQLSGVDNPDLFPSICAGHYSSPLLQCLWRPPIFLFNITTYNFTLQMLQTLQSQYVSVGYLPEEAAMPLLHA